MKSKLLLVCIFTLLVLVCLIVCRRDDFIMTLGDYGKHDPIWCRETRPRNGICNSCKLACGEAKYKNTCLKCIAHLNRQSDGA